MNADKSCAFNKSVCKGYLRNENSGLRRRDALRGSGFTRRRAINPGFDERVGPGLHHSSLYEAGSAVDRALDFLTRKNEPIVGGAGGCFGVRWRFGVVALRLFGLRLRRRYLAQKAGFVERLLAQAFPFGLKLIELFAIFLDGAVDALLVEGEALEVFGFIEEGLGASERGVDFGMVDVDVHGVREVAEREHVVFDGADSLQTPEVLRDDGRELEFDGAFGLEAVDEFLNELVVRDAIFLIHDADLTGDAMAQGIH